MLNYVFSSSWGIVMFHRDYGCEITVLDWQCCSLLVQEMCIHLCTEMLNMLCYGLVKKKSIIQEIFTLIPRFYFKDKMRLVLKVIRR